jgi:elongation factor P
MATTADIKKGLNISHNGDLWRIMDFQHVKPGKGGAFVRTKIKSLTNGKIVDYTYNSGEKIEIVSVIRRPFQFLYADDNGYTFMDNSSYEQVVLNKDMVEGVEYLKEGGEVEITFHEEEARPLSCEVPDNVILRITYTEPGVKGDTANNPMKKATLETGAVIDVPLFVETDTLVRVNTREGIYQERVKE